MVTETDVIVLTVAVVADVATNNYVIPSLEQEPCRATASNLFVIQEIVSGSPITAV